MQTTEAFRSDKLCYRTKPEVKRQRTSSRSPSNSPVIESEDDSTKASAPKQKPRGAAARSQREKEQREKEREQERTEAANRRKGRAERRKADGMPETAVRLCARLTAKQSLKLQKPHPLLLKSQLHLHLSLYPRHPRHQWRPRGPHLLHDEAAGHHKSRAVVLAAISTPETHCQRRMAHLPQTNLRTLHNRVAQMATATGMIVATELLRIINQPNRRTRVCTSCRGTTLCGQLALCRAT